MVAILKWPKKWFWDYVHFSWQLFGDHEHQLDCKMQNNIEIVTCKQFDESI